MKNGILTILVIIVVLVAAGVGSLVWVSNRSKCDLAPKGSVLYIRLTSYYGGNTPVTNATIDATPVETCSGVNTTIAIIYQPTVNASGIATLDASDVSFYSVTVHYGTQSAYYVFVANVQNSPATCANVRIAPAAGSNTVSPC